MHYKFFSIKFCSERYHCIKKLLRKIIHNLEISKKDYWLSFQGRGGHDLVDLSGIIILLMVCTFEQFSIDLPILKHCMGKG